MFYVLLLVRRGSGSRDGVYDGGCVVRCNNNIGGSRERGSCMYMYIYCILYFDICLELSN